MRACESVKQCSNPVPATNTFHNNYNHLTPHPAGLSAFVDSVGATPVLRGEEKRGRGACSVPCSNSTVSEP